MGAATDNTQKQCNDPAFLLDSAEDTDPTHSSVHDDASLPDDEEGVQPKWALRGGGCFVFLVAIGLIIYGIRDHLRHPHEVLGDEGLPATPEWYELLSDKPQGDPRIYQYAKLPNGLEMLNVADNRTLRSAFSMAVMAGSFDESDQWPGLARLCEHMLFQGTKDFPDAVGFDNFMAAHGGSNNALTMSEVTLYFAELAQEAMEDGLTRFQDFFDEPLFEPKYAENEINAIASEHTKNVQSSVRQVLEVMNSVADAESPVSRFHAGDRESLLDKPKEEKMDIVQALQVFFKEHYCPSRMRLVTFGPDTVNKQMALATELFSKLGGGSDVCRGNRKSFALPNPWPPDRMQKWIHIRGSQPQAELWVHFSLPDLRADFASQPLSYIDYVMTYGGEKSFVNVLRDTVGLVGRFSTMYDSTSAGTSMYLQFQLTRHGSAYPYLVLDALFAYIAILRRSTEASLPLYESLEKLARLRWNWPDLHGPMSTTRDLSEKMSRLPVQNILSGDTRIEKPDPKLVANRFKMLVPSKMNVAYVSHSNLDQAHESRRFMGSTPAKLKHFNVQYSVQQLDDVLNGSRERWNDWLGGYENEAGILGLLGEEIRRTGIKPLRPLELVQPSAITDIPRFIDQTHMFASQGEDAPMRETTESKEEYKKNMAVWLYGVRPEPLQLRGNLQAVGGRYLEGAEVWYRSGWVSVSPKVSLSMLFRPPRTPDVRITPLDDLNLEIYSHLLEDEIGPKLVDLTVRGTSYQVALDAQGLKFEFAGFPEDIPRLMEAVAKEFNRFNADLTLTEGARFQRAVDHLQEDLSVYSGLPGNYAIQDRNLILTKGSHSRKELLDALPKVKHATAVESVWTHLLSKPLRLTALSMGNIKKETARTAIANFSNTINSARHDEKVAARGEVERVTPIVDISRPVEIRKKNPHSADPNDAVVVSIIVGVATVEDRVHMGILGQILRLVAYNELRTNKQLGYVVNAGMVLLSNVLVMSTMVQSQVTRAEHLEAAIEAVLTGTMPQRVEMLSDKDFDSYKDTFRRELLEPPYKTRQEVEHFWGPIAQGGKCFDLQHEMLRYIDSHNVTKTLLKSEWKKLAIPEEGMRRKVVVKYFAGEVVNETAPDEAKEIWEKGGVPKDVLPLLERERVGKTVHYSVDSHMRSQLVDEGGYFPTDEHCKLRPPGSSLASLQGQHAAVLKRGPRALRHAKLESG